MSPTTLKPSQSNDTITKRDSGIASLFVRRPVFAVVISLLIVIAGMAAYSGIEIRELPNIDQPVVTVRTNYTGADPLTMDRNVTAIIEGAAARVPGVVSIASQSSAGQSRVTVSFDVKADINVAANDLRDAVSRVRGLPTTDPNFSPPQIVKANADDQPIMQLAATSATMKIEDLTQLVNDVVVPKLSAVEGVADVQLSGDRNPLMQIIIDPDALAARRLTVNDLITAVNNVTYTAPAGSISDYDTTILVQANAAATTASEIGGIQINSTTKVSDVASVIFGPASATSALRVNGEGGLGIGIVRQANANTLNISGGVKKAVSDLKPILPKGVNITITSNDADYVSQAIEEVLITLGLAITIVVAVIYVFLRSTRVTFIPAVTVPIALTGTLAAMWLAGFSINIITLLAIVLATGLVVDDAIVVIENISRQRALGLGPRAAAVIGTRQVFLAVLATTCTLIAVFVPISFLPGVAGSLFSEFGFVLAFAVTLSGIVALTLTPMLASRWIGEAEAHHTAHNIFGRTVVALGEFAVRVYSRLLNAALAAPIVVLLIAFLFAGAAYVGFRLLPSELAPSEDRGVVSINVGSPPGSTVDYAQSQIKLIESAAMPFVQNGAAVNIVSQSRGFGGGGFVSLTLAPFGQRTLSQDQITSQLSQKVQNIPGVQVFAQSGNGLGIGGGGGGGLTFAILGTDYDTLSKASDALIAAMNDDPVFNGPRVNYNTTQAQLSINIDRQRASDLGIPLTTISAVVQTLLQGKNVGNFNVGDNTIQINVAVPTGFIQDPAALDDVQLRTANAGAGGAGATTTNGTGGAATATVLTGVAGNAGNTTKMVPLSSLVSFSESAIAPNLPRQDLHRAIPVSSGLGDGVDLRTAMDEVQVLAAKALPAGMTISFTGAAKTLNDTSSNVAKTFVFALLVVLLVLAAQFESFTSAFILVATVPFGLGAAVFAMLLTHGSLNIYSEIGLVMLVGLMSKNGILMVEFANQLRDAGQTVSQAIRNAALIRLRPVVMTMIATVLGGMPLVLRTGAGSEARHALGWVIVGGLGFATVFTLFLTPVVYELLARFSKPRMTEEKRLARELAAAEAAPGTFEPTPEEIGEVGSGYPVPAE
jgi:HAE1 family hydrophobic/amphiphilic exporter-1